MLLSKVDPRERLGKRVRVRLQTGAACESLPHDPTEDGRTGTVRRCERRPHALAHY